MKIVTLKLKEEEMALIREAKVLIERRFPVSRHALMKQAVKVGLHQLIREINPKHELNDSI